MKCSTKRNNPFNLRYSKRNKWLGQVGSYRGFCVFSAPDYGVRAAILLVRNYIRVGFDTVDKIITRFAPPAENSTDVYISFCSRPSVGSYVIPHDKPIMAGSADFYILLQRMAIMESNTYFTIENLKLISQTFKIFKT